MLLMLLMLTQSPRACVLWQVAGAVAVCVWAPPECGTCGSH
jgi:hypothetical protein